MSAEGVAFGSVRVRLVGVGSPYLDLCVLCVSMVVYMHVDGARVRLCVYCVRCEHAEGFWVLPRYMVRGSCAFQCGCAGSWCVSMCM